LHRNLTCGVPEVEVQAATLLLGGAPAAAYSMSGRIGNQTDIPLKLISKGGNGDWIVKPPALVEAGGTAEFSLKYDGFRFHGSVAYVPASPIEGEWKFGWTIPLFGNNSIWSDTTIPDARAWSDGGRGWHATAWWYLGPRLED
jgi:hypothetical protein